MVNRSRIHAHRQYVFGPPRICLQGILPARDLGRGPFDAICPPRVSATSYLFRHTFVRVQIFMYRGSNGFLTLNSNAGIFQTIMHVQQGAYFCRYLRRLRGVGTRLCGFTQGGIISQSVGVVPGTSPHECSFQTPATIALQDFRDSGTAQKLLVILSPPNVVSIISGIFGSVGETTWIFDPDGLPVVFCGFRSSWKTQVE